MANVVVVGTQWGDEGKGKVVDVLGQRAAAVIRFQGGNNAGHTLVVAGQKRVLHLLPSGALHPGVLNIIAHGVVIDPEVLLGEMDALRVHGVDLTPDRLAVSLHAHVILPYHKQLDKLRETAAGEAKIGTTGRGIGPAYEDKVARRGVRIVDLLDAKKLKARLVEVLPERRRLIGDHYGGEAVDVDALVDAYGALGERLRPYARDTVALIHDIHKRGGNLLFEGAQATFLDIDHGTYPYVTSSNCVAGAACTGAGVGPGLLHEVIGIAKAYCTRVGAGPFPTEAHGEGADQLRALGHEFGSTTGRPRRCGWFDAALVRRAALLNGLTRLALMKLDVLSHFQSIPVCTGWEGEGDLGDMKPVWEELPGWNQDITGCRRFEDLPPAARAYVDRLQTLIDVPIDLVSVGPDRAQTLTRGLFADLV